MTILDRIIADKKTEIEIKKTIIPISQLEQSVLFDRPQNSLKERLCKSQSGVIAEHKRRSPSKAVINQSLNVQDVAKGYEQAGVCGMSVLTDTRYFGGNLDDLLLARASCEIPLLRKDFIIDTYQILEAKAYGADVILLIAAVLTQQQIKDLSLRAKELNLEVLLEVHNEAELYKALMPSLDMIGVNNRNLKTFKVDLKNSQNLSNIIPDDFVKVSESGISSVEAINNLKHYGYQGFLIGENFMKSENPGQSAKDFIEILER
ncbi:MAG: indole-3-glycerol phosphate synthase TrpC [Flavobacteriaceae bacterium]